MLCVLRGWATFTLNHRLPSEYPEIGVFRITDDSIYLFRSNASPEGVPGQRPHLWAFVAPTSSSMGVWVSVAPLGVCGSVVLVYGRVGLRRPFGRLWLRRPLLWAFGSPSPLFGVLGQRPHLWMLLALSSSFIGVSCFRSRDAEKPRMSPIARWNTAALLIPRQRSRFGTNVSLEGISGQGRYIWAFAAPSTSFVGAFSVAHNERLYSLFVAAAGPYVFGFGEKSPR